MSAMSTRVVILSEAEPERSEGASAESRGRLAQDDTRDEPFIMQKAGSKLLGLSRPV